MSRTWLALIVGLVLGGVAGWAAHASVGGDGPEAGGIAAGPAGGESAGVGGAPAPDDPAADPLAFGKQVYDRSCAACHTMRPPPRLAPPVVGLVDHLRERFDSRDSAIAHIIRFVPSPSPEGSALPPMAIDRFGLMPPLPLPEEELRAVALWMWEQYDPDFQHMQGPGHGQGRRGPGATR